MRLDEGLSQGTLVVIKKVMNMEGPAGSISRTWQLIDVEVMKGGGSRKVLNYLPIR